MASMDIFKQDAFSTVTLTDAVQKLDYRPSLLRDMGIFEKQPSRTRSIMIEKKEGTNVLVPVSQRGEPLSDADRIKRDIRNVDTVRLAKGATIYADEVQDIRAFGSETELMGVQQLVAERVESIQGDIELTEENMMLGAVQGIVVDADGSTVIHDWFDFWGIAQPTEINFDLANATVAALKKNIKNVIRTMTKAGKGAFTPQTEIIALCGDDFFDDLLAHQAYTGSTQNPVEAQRLADEYGNLYSAVKFEKITWINYRGTDDGSTVAIDTNQVKFFPKNAKGVFKHGLAPAEFAPYVNTLGKERYAITIPDRDRNAWVKTELYTYPLFYCTRPELLLRGKRA